MPDDPPPRRSSAVEESPSYGQLLSLFYGLLLTALVTQVENWGVSVKTLGAVLWALTGLTGLLVLRLYLLRALTPERQRAVVALWVAIHLMLTMRPRSEVVLLARPAV